MSKQFKAILFDMDGTLIDSMGYHVTAWTTAFRESGYETDDLIFFLNEGVRHPLTVKQRLSELGIENPGDELIKKIYTRKREIFESIVQIRPIEGVMKLLDKLKGVVKLGIVTGGVRNVVERVVSEHFEGFFDIVVDYESTERGKPDPDPFAYGAKLTGYPNENVLAVENAPTGVKSAVDAGLTCWAVCNTLDAKYLAGAHRVFDNFHQIQKALFEGTLLHAPK